MILNLLHSWQIAKTARLVVCPVHSDMKSLTNGIVSAARDLKSWIDVRDSKFRSEMKDCLYREFHWVIHLLLCDGEKSVEIIKILREEILEAMCWQSDDLFCRGLMWITERKQVRFITRFMIKTDFCKMNGETTQDKTAGDYEDRRKKQYDLATLYDIYYGILCTSRQDLINIFWGNDPDTQEGVSSDVKLLTVFIRFRGPFCCIGRLTSYRPSTQ